MNISFIESSKFGSTLYDSFIIHREEVFNVSSKVSQIVFALILIVLSRGDGSVVLSRDGRSGG